MMSQNGLFTMEKWHKEATLKQYGLLLLTTIICLEYLVKVNKKREMCWKL